MAEEILVNYVVTIDGLKAELKKAQDEFKKTEESATKGLGKTDEVIKDTTKSTTTLTTQLKELKKQISLATDPKDVERLAKAAAVVQKEINAINKQVDAFTKSKYQNVATAFGDIGYKIKSLDFAGAAKESKKLLAAVNAISFKDVVSSVKDVGATLINVGKSLLANPLFILAGVIVGISKAAYDMANAMRMVDVQTKTVTDAINEQTKSIRAYSDRVAEVYITLSQGLGKLSQAQADVKRAEIKNNQELIANKEKYSEDLVKLATELGVNLSKLQNGFFDETYKGDFEDLQNKKRFNIEKQKLDRLYHQQNMAAVKTQLLEKLGIEIQGNLDSIKKSQDFLKANREKQKADRQKEAEDALLEAERLAKVLRDLETANIRLTYDRRKQQILNNFADEAKKYAGHLDILTQLDIQRENQLLDLYNEREKEYEKIRKEAVNKNVEIFKEGSDKMKAEDTSFAVHVKNNQEDIVKNAEKTEKQRQELNQATIDFLVSSINSLQQISNNLNEQALNDERAKADAEIAIQQERFDKGLITKEQYEANVDIINKKAAEKERDLKKQQFEANKNAAVIGALISTAQGVAGALAQSAELGYAAFVLAALIAASGALQVAAIESQPTPKFEKGGRLKGKRHREGGIMIEAERDEWIINRNESMKNDKLLKAINDGKGDKFIFDHYIAPSLKAQQRKNAESKEKSFASNLAQSMNLNFKDGNLLDSLKQSRRNDKEIALYLVKELKGTGYNSRKW